MYGFEFGAYKTRKINLGGKTNQQDKKSLLKNTLAERKIRQENKLKNKSATKIQVIITHLINFYLKKKKKERKKFKF